MQIIRNIGNLSELLALKTIGKLDSRVWAYNKLRKNKIYGKEGGGIKSENRKNVHT